MVGTAPLKAREEITVLVVGLLNSSWFASTTCSKSRQEPSDCLDGRPWLMAQKQT